jgi:hypothetical protein
MPSVRDTYTDIYVGKTYGKWAVIGTSEYRPFGKYDYLSLCYLCQCNCQKQTIRWVMATKLRNGYSTNCGCEYQEKRQKKAGVFNFTGFEWGTDNKHFRVNYETDNFVSISGRKKRQFSVTHIECDETFNVLLQVLQRNSTNICPVCDKRIEIKTGDVFGRWLVLEESRRIIINAKGHTLLQYKCKCSCEKQTVKWVSSNTLKSGTSCSCGCLEADNAREKATNSRRLIGMLFTRWEVIEGPKFVVHKKTGKTAKYWLCKCVCEKQTIKWLTENTLLMERSKSCGCYKRYIIQQKHSGENHWNWKGGINESLREEIRHSIQMTDWVRDCMKRDVYTCQYSDKQGGRLSVHHIKPFSTILEENNITTLEEALACEELWNISNGITLTREWHLQGSEYEENSFHNIYGQANCTAEDFKRWFMQLGNWYEK